MPDGMTTPEKSGVPISPSVQSLRRAGPTAEQMKQWQGPEWRSKTADMELEARLRKESDDFMATGGDPEKMAEYLAAMERGLGGGQERYESGRALESTLARHYKPETIIEVVRLLQAENEKGETGGELTTDYDVGRVTSILRDRKVAVGIPLSRLFDLELVRELDDETFIAVKENLKDFKKGDGSTLTDDEIKKLVGIPEVGGYGLRTLPVEIERLESYERDDRGEKTKGRYRRISTEVTYYATDGERKGFSQACESSEKELYIRHLIHRNKKFYLHFREALNRIVELYFGPVPTTKAIDHLLNLPFRKGEKREAVSGAEFRNFGDKIEIAMRLYYINAICQKPARFNKLMQTPGWNFVFPKKDGVDREKLIKEWVGEPGKWVPEPYEDPAMPGQFESPLGSVRSRDTLKIENGYVEGPDEKWKYCKDKDLRGKLTRRNIFAEENTWDKDLHEAIREFIGGGKNANEVDRQAVADAQNLGYWLFKLWLIADNEGYEVYKDPEMPEELGFFKDKELQFENGPASSDFSKLMFPSGYNLKNKRKHLKSPLSRDYGPEGSFGKIPRFCTDFLRLIATNVRNNDVVETLSFYEQWWGYPEDAKNNLPKVPSKRLGELPWEEAKFEEISNEDAEALDLPVRGISEEALQGLYLTTYMAGRDRESNGAYPITLDTSFGGLKILEDPSFWLKFNKALDVGVGKGVAVNGEFRGKTEDEVKKKRKRHIQAIFDAYWEGVASTEDYAIAYDKNWSEGRGMVTPVPMTEKIRMVAKKAGIDLPKLEPTHRSWKMKDKLAK